MITSLLEFGQYDFLFYAGSSTVLLCLSAGLLSPVIVSKKLSFLGSALSHSAFLGLSISHLVLSDGGYWNLFFGTLMITVALGLILAALTFKESIPRDSMIGVFYTMAMALGLLLNSLFQEKQIDLLGFLFGNILAIEKNDLILAFSLMALSFLGFFFKKKEWKYFLIDPHGAEANGINTKRYYFLLIAALTLIIVSFTKIAGTILVNTILITPGLFGINVGTSVKESIQYSLIFSFSTGILGLIFANYFDTPASATMALVQLAGLLIFAPGFIFRRKKPAHS